MLAGVIVWIALYGIFSVIAPNLLSDDASRPPVAPRYTVGFAFLSYLVAGIVTGFMAKRSPLMQGALLGLVAAAIPVVFALLVTVVTSPWIAGPHGGLSRFFAWEAFVPSLVIAAVMCSLGAILGDYAAGSRRAP